MARSIHEAGYNILQVFSRNLSSARKLAFQLNAVPIDDLSELNHNADLFIICVSDDALEEIANSIKSIKTIVVHTSGSHAMSVLNNSSPDIGVLYPLQTFSAEKPISFDKVPLCIEANNNLNRDILKEFAFSFSNQIHFISSDERKLLHLAGVFACNFPNLMYAIAASIVDSSGISFEILKPLIRETADKAIELHPFNAQTGPAYRNDTSILQKHIILLESQPEYQDLYKTLSKLISRIKTNG